MPDDAGPDRFAVTSNDVEDPGRKDVGRQLGQPQSRERRPLGWLEHDAVASRQRWGDLPDRHHQRVVPGRDRADHSDWLPPDHAGVAPHVLTGRLALEQARRSGKEAQMVDARGELVREKQGARFPDVGGFEVGELDAVGVDRLRQLQQHLAPFLGNGLEPLRVRLARGLDGAVDVGFRALRDLGDGFPGRGVDDRLALAAVAGHPLAADEHLAPLDCRCHPFIHPPLFALRSLAATLRISPMGEGPGPKSKELQAERDRYLPRGMASTMSVFAASGSGATLTDVDGNSYIDFATGISVMNVGHGHPRVVGAIRAQVEQLVHSGGPVMLPEVYIRLARRLCEITPGALPKKALLLNRGAAAVENAIKIVTEATGRPDATRFHNSFHGRTLMAMTLTGKVAPYKQNFGPYAPEV